MNTRLLLGMAAVLCAAPVTAQVRAPGTEGVTRREPAAERRDAMRQRREAQKAMTPERRAAARAMAQERFNALPADQQQLLRERRAYSQALREKARDLRAQVAAGTLTKDAMAEQLRAFRDANRPARPDWTRKPTP